MIYIIIFVMTLISVFFPKVRCILFKFPYVIYYIPKDIYYYFKQKKYNNAPIGFIASCNGLFGKGKTLTAVHFCYMMYKRYNNKVVYCPRRKKFVRQRIKILTNIYLKDIPYEKLIDLSQIIYNDKQRHDFDDEHNILTVTICLIDESSTQLNCRSFKNVSADLINSFLTCRHNYTCLYWTSPRFSQTDILLRQVTIYSIDCRKTWRLQGIYYYDAWEMENATSPLLLKPYKKSCWFVKNSDYNRYDTYELVEKLKKASQDGDMISDEEVIALRMNGMEDIGQVINPSRKYKHIQKRMYK